MKDNILFTNIQNFDENLNIVINKSRSSSWRKLFKQVYLSKFVLWSNPGIKIMAIFAVLRIFLLKKFKLYYYDVIMPPYKFNMKFVLNYYTKIILLKFADKIFTVHKDKLYSKYLYIAPSKECYVGFKCNNYERIHNYSYEPNKKYILACGQSYRDYNIFNFAIKDIKLPAKVLLPPSDSLLYHGTILPQNFDESIEVVHHNDFSRKTWDKIMKDAYIIVIPLIKECIQPAGISVYLEAMAFRKPVVISKGTSTNGLLIHDYNACIVPAGDVSSLSHYIRKLWEDKEYYNYISGNGYNYAMQLGGLKRLSNDIYKAIKNDL